MRTRHQILTAAALLTLATLSLYAAVPTGRVVFKIDGVAGYPSAAGKGEWIEIASLAMTNTGDQGTIQGRGNLCSMRGPIATVAMEIDGQKHELRNVQLSDCQVQGNETRFAFTYGSCTSHGTAPYDHSKGGGSLAAMSDASTRASRPKAYDHTVGGGSYSPNAKLIGAGPTPVAVQVELLTLNGSGASLDLIKELTGTLVLNAQQKLPSLTVELTNGQKWTFSDVEVLSAKSSTKDGRPMESVSFYYNKVEGPSTGFQARR